MPDGPNFVDRVSAFVDEQAAMVDLERFACRVPRAYPHRPYKTEVTPLTDVVIKKDLNWQLADKMV